MRTHSCTRRFQSLPTPTTARQWVVLLRHLPPHRRQPSLLLLPPTTTRFKTLQQARECLAGILSHKLAFVPLGQLCHMHQVLLVLLQLLNIDVGLPPVPGITRLPTAKACQCDFPFPFAVKLAATSQGLCCHCLLVLVPVFASEV